jgi:hypothetical protein
VTSNGDAPTLAPAERVRLGLALQGAAQALVDGVPDDADHSVMLEHLGALRVIFDAVDAGNAVQGKPPGPLRPYRTALFHQLADQRVARDLIAETAGVSANAIGFAMKGHRRGREVTRPKPDPVASPAAAGPARARRPRPD